MDKKSMNSATIVAETGKVVQRCDSIALVAAINELIEMDAEQRKSLGVVARQRIVANYSLEKMISKYEKLYFNVLNINS
jgi:glycosyltransferase involved in cell wall biosynthesis